MLNDPILREIGVLTRTIHAIVEVNFKSLNLKKGQSLYLTRICEKPGINLKQLSQILMVDKTTTTKVIQKLIEEKLVVKVQDSSDKRAFQLFPTEKAKETYEIVIEEENRLTNQCFIGFDEKQKVQIREMIKTMGKNIEEDWYTLKKYKQVL